MVSSVRAEEGMVSNTAASYNSDRSVADITMDRVHYNDKRL
jgi:hypothetical protein